MDQTNCKYCSSKQVKFMPTKGPFLYNSEKCYLSEPINLLTCESCKSLNLSDSDKLNIDNKLTELAWENSGDSCH